MLVFFFFFTRTGPTACRSRNMFTSLFISIFSHTSYRRRKSCRLIDQLVQTEMHKNDAHGQRSDMPKRSCLFPVLISSRGIQQQLSSYRETVIRQATVAAGSVHRDDAPTCGICHKTKFADGCGNLCSYCQTKFCARCGGRVSLRSNTVRERKRGVTTTFSSAVHSW